MTGELAAATRRAGIKAPIDPVNHGLDYRVPTLADWRRVADLIVTEGHPLDIPHRICWWLDASGRDALARNIRHPLLYALSKLAKTPADFKMCIGFAGEWHRAICPQVPFETVLATALNTMREQGENLIWIGPYLVSSSIHLMVDHLEQSSASAATGNAVPA